MSALYQIISTVTVTTASPERAFSKLKLIKTDLRNRLSDGNLNNEMLISINRHVELTPNEVLSRYCKENNIKIIV